MAKAKTVFLCDECGETSPKWMGRCPGCGAWNTMVEERVHEAPKGRSAAIGFTGSKPLKLNEVSTTQKERVSTGVGELDTVLGGGMLPGSLVLIGGEPGIGKSTLLLMICEKLGQNGTVLYVSGEESQEQIKMRADRLKVTNENVYLLTETNITNILENIEATKPFAVIIDSVQTMYTEDVQSAPGSVSQVREVTMQLMRLAKETGITVFLVGHVTKDGNVAGPRVLEHMVDCMLYFEGDRNRGFRKLRAVKNRFGGTNEVGIFEMTDKGLAEVPNPSAVLLQDMPEDASGSAIVCLLEGSRPILSEVQALVSKTGFGIPRRTADGFDHNRLSLLIAVIEKRLRISLSEYDVYINVVGGMRIDDTSADLAVICALLSGLFDVPMPSDTVIFGEVGLSGEVRRVKGEDLRLKEIGKLGFSKCILPKGEKRQTELSLCEIKKIMELPLANKGRRGDHS